MNYLNKKTVEDIDVSGKKVLVRCDFNVPFDAEGNISDPKRINEALKTIKYLKDHGAKVILCSHLGRPKGEFNMKYSLAPVAAYLTKALGQEVKMAKDVVGESAKELAASLKDGDVMLIENVRFHKEEEKNDPEFAKQLASLADIYVNDAFGTAHRAHASTAGVADYLPAVCGYLIQKEITVMGGALTSPKRPFVAILGGAKVSDKIGVITNLIDKCDTLIIGGAMAYTFAAAQGRKIGSSKCEEDKIDLAKEILAKAEAKGICALMPSLKTPTPRCSKATSKTAGWVWISARRPWNCMLLPLRMPARLYGTARWAYSKWLRLPRAPLLWLRPLQTATLFPSSAAATPLRLWKPSALPTR